MVKKIKYHISFMSIRAEKTKVNAVFWLWGAEICQRPCGPYLSHHSFYFIHDSSKDHNGIYQKIYRIFLLSVLELVLMYSKWYLANLFCLKKKNWLPFLSVCRTGHRFCWDKFRSSSKGSVRKMLIKPGICDFASEPVKAKRVCRHFHFLPEI